MFGGCLYRSPSGIFTYLDDGYVSEEGHGSGDRLCPMGAYERGWLNITGPVTGVNAV